MPGHLLTGDEATAADRILDEAARRHGAHAVARVREALNVGTGRVAAHLAESPMQRPAFLFPGLSARAWHDPRDFVFSRRLEAHALDVAADLAQALSGQLFQPYRQDRDYFIPHGKWDALYLCVGGIWLEEARALCPNTFQLLESVPRLADMAMFSALRPGGHITPHCGTWNCRITFHLGISVPDHCAIRVGDGTQRCTEGKLLVFDDSFEHEAWNDSNATRIVLLFDVWHPDLTDVEVTLLEELRAKAGLNNGQDVVTRIRAERAALLHDAATSEGTAL